ncbi:MAG: outer membrane protein assembly factor BamB [Verrucomicrobiales bacterium]|jgi:outer membrane protein assembly factor BamB
MVRNHFGLVYAGILILSTSLASAAADEDVASAQWPNFRGPLGTGVAPLADPPLEWAEDKNVNWKLELPGLGHSSPVVWGDQIFLTAATAFGDPLSEPKFSGRPGAHNNLAISRQQRFLVFAVDRENGEVAWQSTVHEQLPHEGGHETGTFASASPITDGERVYAFFGSYGIFCLDAKDGKVLWNKDFGDQFTKHGHGEGASPALFGDVLVANWDHEGHSFIAAFDKRTGEPKWRTLRDERTSWSTPIVAEVDGKPQVIVSATNAVRGYDLKTGEEIWKASGLSDNVVATPIFEDGIVYALSSYTFRAGMAISIVGASGDLTETDRILWKRDDRTPYIPSPLLYDGMLYYLAHYQGVLTRAVAETGEEPTGPFRLPEVNEIYASPVAAAGRIYFVDRSGRVLVIAAEAEPKPLALNELEDSFSATPALIGDELILRGEKFLYSIRDKK